MSSTGEVRRCDGDRKLFQLRRFSSRAVGMPVRHVPCFIRVPTADSDSAEGLDYMRTLVVGVGAIVLVAAGGVALPQ